MRGAPVQKTLAALALAACAISGADSGSSAIDPKVYWDEVNYLASPELKGRATGSPELEKAAAFIAKKFESFGLMPVDGQFEQAFLAEIGAHLGRDNSFAYEESGKRTSLNEEREYVPFAFSTNGKFSGGVVFAGYGITAKQYQYDDYAGVDVKDKIVLILRHEPQEFDEKSVFAGRKLTSYATFTDKMENAKMHGARGVIWVNDVFAHANRLENKGREKDALEKFGANDGPRDAGIFFIQMKEATAEAWLKAEGRDLAAIAADIDRDLKPQSFPLAKTTVQLAVNVVHEVKTVHNVTAYLPGQTNEYVIIGAHYDHLGLGDSHSLAPSQLGTIHPGADDNASGTAGVIELARYFAAKYSKVETRPKRGILFMTFAGEELGLLGSSWYVNHPEMPEENAITMVNLDMIGRIRGGRVFVSGAETGSGLQKLLDDTKLPAPLKVDESGKDSGTDMSDASDHASFVSKRIPVLFFFSGLHGDYHKPSDTADKIDAADAAKLLEYVAAISDNLANAAGRPAFVKVVRHPAAQTPSSTQSASGYGPDFGSIPDFNEPPKGVRFADVREGSPAAKAGLKAGDILISFGGKEIGNLYDFTYALRDHQPGDEVLVKVLRGSQTIEAKVLLTERR